MISMTILAGVLVEVLIYVVVSIMLVGLVVAGGSFLVRSIYEKAGKTASKLIEDAQKKSEDNRKATLLETKQEIHRL